MSEPTSEDYSFYSSLYRNAAWLQSGEVLAIARKAIATAGDADCIAPKTIEERGFKSQALALTNKGVVWQARFDFKRPYKILADDEVKKAESCIPMSAQRQDPSCRQYAGIRYVRYLSLPLFNRDHSRAMVSIARVCGGLCGEGSTQVHRKENGVFKLETGAFAHCSWIS